MKSFLYVGPTLLAFAASLVAEPPAAPKIEVTHPRAAAALALVFVPAPPPARGRDDPAAGDPFAPGNAVAKPVKLPPTCDCGPDCAGGKDCPGNCNRTTCVNAPTTKRGCGCSSPESCTCTIGSCDCEICAARKTAKGKSPRPDGEGYCSNQCTCGCNGGLPCRCGSAKAARLEFEPCWQPALPSFQYRAPAGCAGGS